MSDRQFPRNGCILRCFRRYRNALTAIFVLLNNNFSFFGSIEGNAIIFYYEFSIYHRLQRGYEKENSFKSCHEVVKDDNRLIVIEYRYKLFSIEVILRYYYHYLIIYQLSTAIVS